MKSRTFADAAALSGDARATRQLNRGITATWWYTVSAIAFFESMIIVVWVAALLGADSPTPVLFGVGVGGLLWFASTLPLLFDYRLRSDGGGLLTPRAFAPLIVALIYGAFVVVTTGIWVIGLLPLAQSLMLLNWPRGVRVRAVVAATIVLGCAWIIDTQGALAADTQGWAVVGFYSTFLPAMTVISLWWWDVLATLDAARASEARLAATQERLRVATDVHDLQGHHLQVIALHLELTVKLMTRDPAAALASLRTARTSVDDARQGTRDLATRFRSVPLEDEIANARDLLSAAGIVTEVSVGPEAHKAPASDLGPVIRETTTNVLRHGGGLRAHLSLDRIGDTWRYAISNDFAQGSVAGHVGSGLEGIGRRVSEAGGRLEVLREDGDFTVIVVVPAHQENER